MRLLALSLFCAFSFVPAIAQAEVAGKIEFKSDDRFRGRSLSDGRPVIAASVTIDADTGIYGGAEGTFILTGKGRAGLRGVNGYVGYARKVNDELSIDVGVAGYAHTQRYSGNRPDRYVEVYAGINAGQLSGYLHYTPDYLDRGVPVVYAELNYTHRLGKDWTLKAHGGLLVQTSGPPRLGKKAQRIDTRLALSWPILGLEAEVAWTFAGPKDAYYAAPWNGRSAVVVSLSKYF